MTGGVVGEALRQGRTIEEIHNTTKYDKWFIKQIYDLINLEKIIKNKKLDKNLILIAKKNGFSDKKIASIINIEESKVRNFSMGGRP